MWTSDQTQQPAVMKRYQPLVTAWHSLYKVTPEYVSSHLRLDQHNVATLCQQPTLRPHVAQHETSQQNTALYLQRNY